MMELIKKMSCKIIPKNIKHIDIRLFEEEIEEAEFVCLVLKTSYEQFFVKCIKEKLKEMGM